MYFFLFYYHLRHETNCSPLLSKCFGFVPLGCAAPSASQLHFFSPFFFLASHREAAAWSCDCDVLGPVCQQEGWGGMQVLCYREVRCITVLQLKARLKQNGDGKNKCPENNLFRLSSPTILHPCEQKPSDSQSGPQLF